MAGRDRTHDPKRRSWIASANTAATDFPIQNLPYGIFNRFGERQRVGVAIGDLILDLSELEAAGMLNPAPSTTVFDQPSLNPFMSLGPGAWSSTRLAIGDLLDAGSSWLRNDVDVRMRALVRMSEANLYLPFAVRSFTDFFSSMEHATNTGAMFADPANALTPNWLHIPIAYNGRASTVVVSRTGVRRPLGQLRPQPDGPPVLAPSRKLDIELEMGVVIGMPSRMGEPITTAQADEMIFGFVLLNDWSARDIQAWERLPLGPFQSKSFATSISPWVVTRLALDPFRVPTPALLKPLLPYLAEHAPGNFDIELEVELRPAEVKQPTRISMTNFKYMYYSPAQQLTHHALGGCAMCTGDLLGSGTVSGPTKDSLGSLLEMTRDGTEPLALEGGARRGYLEDGDEVVLRGRAIGSGYQIGFGSCEARILPAPEEPSW